MLNILIDGPFRYIHCGATGQLILTLEMARNANHRLTGRFIEFDGDGDTTQRTLREWKAIARHRISGRLITDGR